MQLPLPALHRAAQPGGHGQFPIGAVLDVREAQEPAGSGLLALVHGPLGQPHQRFCRTGVLGEQADADARRRVHLGRADPDRLLQRPGDAVGDRLGGQAAPGAGSPLRGDTFQVGQEHQELVASLTRHQVRLPAGFREAVGDLCEQRVAPGVTKRVVHELEVVEIDVQHAHRQGAPAGPREGQVEMLHEQVPVRESGQAVVVGQKGQPLLGLLAIRDVVHHPVHEQGQAIGITKQGGLVQKPHHAPVPSQHPVLGGEPIARFSEPRLVLQGPPPVVRVELPEPQPRVCDPFFRQEPQDRLDLGAHVGPVARLPEVR